MIRLQELKLVFGGTEPEPEPRTDGWTDRCGSRNSYLDVGYDYVNNTELSLPEEINRAKYRRNMVVMGPCFTRQEIPAYFLISSGGLEGSASHLYLRQAGRPIF